jgi:hypothetical protein
MVSWLSQLQVYSLRVRSNSGVLWLSTYCSLSPTEQYFWMYHNVQYDWWGINWLVSGVIKQQIMRGLILMVNEWWLHLVWQNTKSINQQSRSSSVSSHSLCSAIDYCFLDQWINGPRRSWEQVGVADSFGCHRSTCLSVPGEAGEYYFRIRAGFDLLLQALFY